MARLRLITTGFEGHIIVLNLGTNRVGRLSANHFQIEDPSISATHCEILVTGEAIIVRDHHSTNGTFVDGRQVEEATLGTGQILRLGAVECLVEDTEIAVGIPPIEHVVPPPPRVLDSGRLSCARHEDVPASYQCPKCRRLMCPTCVRGLRRKGGNILLVCPDCSNPVTPLPDAEQKKRSWLEFLKTMKLPFTKNPK